MHLPATAMPRVVMTALLLLAAIAGVRVALLPEVPTNIERRVALTGEEVIIVPALGAPLRLEVITACPDGPVDEAFRLTVTRLQDHSVLEVPMERSLAGTCVSASLLDGDLVGVLGIARASGSEGAPFTVEVELLDALEYREGRLTTAIRWSVVIAAMLLIVRAMQQASRWHRDAARQELATAARRSVRSLALQVGAALGWLGFVLSLPFTLDDGWWAVRGAIVRSVGVGFDPFLPGAVFPLGGQFELLHGFMGALPLSVGSRAVQAVALLLVLCFAVGRGASSTPARALLLVALALPAAHIAAANRPEVWIVVLGAIQVGLHRRSPASSRLLVIASSTLAAVGLAQHLLGIVLLAMPAAEVARRLRNGSQRSEGLMLGAAAGSWALAVVATLVTWSLPLQGVLAGARSYSAHSGRSALTGTAREIDRYLLAGDHAGALALLAVLLYGMSVWILRGSAAGDRSGDVLLRAVILMPLLLFFLESKWSHHLIAAGVLAAIVALSSSAPVEAAGSTERVRLLIVPVVLLVVESLRRTVLFPLAWSDGQRLAIDHPLWGYTFIAVVMLSVGGILLSDRSGDTDSHNRWALIAAASIAPVVAVAIWHSIVDTREHLAALSPEFCRAELGADLSDGARVGFTSPLAGILTGCVHGAVATPQGPVWTSPTHVVSLWRDAPGVGYPMEFLVPRADVAESCSDGRPRACLATVR